MLKYAQSKKQKLNSRSSTEAEIIAVSDGLTLIIWFRNLLLAQGYKLPPATVFQDNQSVIALYKNGKGSSSTRTRHIALKIFFVGDRMDKKEIAVEYLPTEEMIADILTKPLVGRKFVEMRAKLMGVDI